MLYLGHDCGSLPDIPLELVIDRRHPVLDQALAETGGAGAARRLRWVFYTVLARHGIRRAWDAQRIIVEAARGSWERGHPLLHAIARACRSRRGPVWSESLAKAVFADRYYARARHRTIEDDLNLFSLERHWRSERRRAVPHYFEAFGVPSALRIQAAKLRKLTLEKLCFDPREPTPAEQHALAVLKRALKALCPELASIAKRKQLRLQLINTDILGGLLREYDPPPVCLALLSQRVFVLDFGPAFAVFAHELAHVFGPDGDRAFTNALTYVIEHTIQRRSQLETHVNAWRAARRNVIRERTGQARLRTAE